jgi:hypothetical protein
MDVACSVPIGIRIREKREVRGLVYSEPDAVSVSFSTLQAGAWNTPALRSACHRRSRRSRHALRIGSSGRSVGALSHRGSATEGRWQCGHVGQDASDGG